MATQPANLTPMRTVTELRAVIDGFAARHAATRVAGGADSGPLLGAFAEMQEAARVGDYDRVAKADRRLHVTIVQLADVQGLAKVWETVAARLDAFRRETIQLCWPDLNVLFEGHRAMVDAICAGDENAAEDAAKTHLDAVWYRLAEQADDGSLPDDPLARTRTYLAFHLQEPIRLEFLARYVAKTSTGHLSRLFRQEHGVSFTRYLRELRMHKAVELLLRSRQPIGRIAASVGYEDGSRFAQHFRKRFGLSPRA